MAHIRNDMSQRHGRKCPYLNHRKPYPDIVVRHKSTLAPSMARPLNSHRALPSATRLIFTDVTLSHSPQCSCRYAACIKAGMNPNAVMTDEQVQHHFRKSIKTPSERPTTRERRRRRSSAPERTASTATPGKAARTKPSTMPSASTTATTSSASSSRSGYSTPPRCLQATSELEADLDFFMENVGEIPLPGLPQSSDDPATNAEPLHGPSKSQTLWEEDLNMESSNLSESSTASVQNWTLEEPKEELLNTPPLERSPSPTTKEDGPASFSARTSKAWQESCASARQSCKEFACKLVRMHLSHADITQGELRSHLSHLNGLFRMFAHSLLEFKRLSEVDQNLLVDCGATKFSQYILARYAHVIGCFNIVYLQVFFCRIWCQTNWLAYNLSRFVFPRRKSLPQVHSRQSVQRYRSPLQRH